MQKDTDIGRMLATIEEEAALTSRYTRLARFSPAVMQAMAEVPRHRFVPHEVRGFAYQNGPLPIGHGQTISQPYIVALMTELLGVGENDTVLEVGTGSGYQTAVLSRIVRQVYSIEIIRALGDESGKLLKSMGYRNVLTRIGDGYHGWPEHAPYDGIIVTAAAPGIPPALVEQLKPGARLVVPVGLPYSPQELMVVTRNEQGDIRQEPILSVAFVPLTREQANT